jgi:hypothetical protein
LIFEIEGLSANKEMEAMGGDDANVEFDYYYRALVDE